ncbi:hypothetical protein Tco_0353981, partial [Tanacetum coccineum]
MRYIQRGVFRLWLAKQRQRIDASDTRTNHRTDSELLSHGNSRPLEYKWKDLNRILRHAKPNPALLTSMDNRLIREARAFDMNKSKIQHQQL